MNYKSDTMQELIRQSISNHSYEVLTPFNSRNLFIKIKNSPSVLVYRVNELYVRRFVTRGVRGHESVFFSPFIFYCLRD